MYVQFCIDLRGTETRLLQCKAIGGRGRLALVQQLFGSIPGFYTRYALRSTYNLNLNLVYRHIYLPIFSHNLSEAPKC